MRAMISAGGVGNDTSESAPARIARRRVGTSASRPAPSVRCAGSRAHAHRAHRLADALDRIEERGIDEHEVRRDRTQHFLELVGLVEDLELEALRLEPLVQLGRDRLLPSARW
jgi:hypothetical protein